MKLLVTGGLGFIGSNFIKHSLSRQPEISIVNLDKIGTGANPDNLKDIDGDDRYIFIKSDISKTSCKDLLTDIDAVINFAAETHVDRSIADPKLFLENNVIGTFNLLEAEREVGRPIKHIQISTDEVYGDILQGSFREDDGYRPSNPYSASKAAADMLCMAYHRTYGLGTIITRCTNNFGPYQFPEKLIPKTIIRAKKNLKIPIYGTGESIIDYIYVEDHCKAINSVLIKGRAGETYNISSGNEYTTLEIVRKILGIINKPKNLITFVDDRPGHDVRYSLDSSKIRKELNWKPEAHFDYALESTVNWYIDNEWWWQPIATKEVLDITPWKRGPTH